MEGECSFIEITIAEVRLKVQQAREEATVKAGEAEFAKQLVGPRLQPDVDKLAADKGLDHLMDQMKQALEEDHEARRNHVLALARIQ